jgi:hypothetical protein
VVWEEGREGVEQSAWRQLQGRVGRMARRAGEKREKKDPTLITVSGAHSELDFGVTLCAFLGGPTAIIAFANVLRAARDYNRFLALFFISGGAEVTPIAGPAEAESQTAVVSSQPRTPRDPTRPMH